MYAIRSYYDQQWEFDRILDGFRESTRYMEWDNAGRLWVSHWFGGIFALSFSPNYDRITKVVQLRIMYAIRSYYVAALHASAISDTKSTILFSAQAGSGKTTISSLLRASGLRLISDDFVPIDGITGLVFPFPTAVSVKEGSIPVLSPYYPSLLAAET